jgi:hypothetical protein
VKPLSPAPKVGDKLAVFVQPWGGPARLMGIYSVYRVTPSGQLVVGKMRFVAGGVGMGSDCGKSLRWPTDADRAEVADRTLRDELIRRIEGADLSRRRTEQLVAAAKALGIEVAT